MNSIPAGTFVDMGSNNGGSCSNNQSPSLPSRPAITETVSENTGTVPSNTGTVQANTGTVPANTGTVPANTGTVSAAAAAASAPAAGDCKVDGLYPDPDICSGFIKCAQVCS